MYTTDHLLRIAKTVSVFSIGFMALLIVIGNTTDYYTNYYFVEHVMKMDTTFPDSAIKYRSISSPFAYHAGYLFIILAEAAMAFCCLKGSWLMYRHMKMDALSFHASKNWAVAGLIIGILVWFFGFEVIGGEWFAMWQSNTWNGLSSAERILSFIVLVLVLLQFEPGLRRD